MILACLILLRVYPKLLSVEWILFNDQTEVTSGQTKHAKNLGCTQQETTVPTIDSRETGLPTLCKRCYYSDSNSGVDQNQEENFGRTDENCLSVNMLDIPAEAAKEIYNR